MSENVSEVVKAETARQTVILIFGVVGVVAMGVASYWVTDEAAWEQAQMKALLTAKKYANRRVEFWADKAAWCSSRYLKLLP